MRVALTGPHDLPFNSNTCSLDLDKKDSVVWARALYCRVKVLARRAGMCKGAGHAFGRCPSTGSICLAKWQIFAVGPFRRPSMCECCAGSSTSRGLACTRCVKGRLQGCSGAGGSRELEAACAAAYIYHRPGKLPLAGTRPGTESLLALIKADHMFGIETIRKFTGKPR